MQRWARILILAGLGAAGLSTETNGMRGITVATLASWSAALARIAVKKTSDESLAGSVFGFAHSLDGWGEASFVLCVGLALWLGSRSFRANASHRFAGT